MQIFAHLGKKLPIALPLLMVGALFIAGCGSSAAATPTATPVPPTATPMPTATPVLNSTFSSSDGVYTFQFPGNWTQNPINTSPIVNGVLIKSPDSTDDFITLPLNQGLPASQYSAFLSSFMTGAGATHVTVKTTSQSLPVGANTWTEYDGTATLGGNPSMTSVLGLTHAGKSFLVIFIAANTNADSVATTYFLPMITSLQLLK